MYLPTHNSLAKTKIKASKEIESEIEPEKNPPPRISKPKPNQHPKHTTQKIPNTKTPKSKHSPLSLCPNNNTLTIFPLRCWTLSARICSSIASLTRRASASRSTRAARSAGDSSRGGDMKDEKGSCVFEFEFGFVEFG
jgi:hypothetical protein